MNKKITTALATAVFVLGASASSAFAATNITISGNGGWSGSSVKVKSGSSTVVKQSNNSHIVNEVNSNANTGGNKANKNVGGSTSINTGSATSNVAVVVGGSSNTANVETCDCDEDVNVTVKNNGRGSHNNVKVSNNNWFSAWQSNTSGIFNHVGSKANTGKNKAKKNISGDVSVDTDDADSSVYVEVNGSSNTLN